MERILLVDDESDITSTMKLVLEKKGFQVVAFNDPSLALQHLRTNAQYDIIFSDMLMPKMDGMEFCRQAKKLNDKIKFCICTAFENVSFRHVSDSNNDQIHRMKKPFDTAELLMTVKALQRTV